MAFVCTDIQPKKVTAVRRVSRHHTRIRMMVLMGLVGLMAVWGSADSYAYTKLQVLLPGEMIVAFGAIVSTVNQFTGVKFCLLRTSSVTSTVQLYVPPGKMSVKLVSELLPDVMPVAFATSFR